MRRDEPKRYIVEIKMTEEHAALVIAGSAIEAMQKARAGEWEDVWATGRVLNRTFIKARKATDDD